MKVLPYLAVLTFSAVTATAAMAQNTGSSTPAKPIVKTTCAEYIGMKETIKPEFISYTVGHAKNGKKEAVFDEVAVEKIKPELDEYCRVNLTKSAYDRVIASSIASEQAARHHVQPSAK